MASLNEHIAVAFIVTKIVCVAVSFVALPCRCLGLECIVAVSTVCAVVLEVGSSKLVAESCFPHGFDLSNT